ncbi:DMT family transporter [Clostridium algidicarnis]|uniref:DMT family transporter n=1 Tax=Clostridium algidicarnis TaxID=37659 RepID=UPI001C0C0CB2|nr:DMT family transporter [Clostridium algidicarnis]MBU3210315.1 DMT family transporter [Clostridium algidicarnis]MBU3228287.1 DMT family transporter [Clostridium algidicarnis]MBU3251344.1 DMT family transporter [Clostridium algidicarnis]
MLYIILAFIGGALVTLASIINSRLGKEIGVIQGTVINYTVGLICILLVCIFNGSLFKMSTEGFSGIPLWAYLGGMVGVAVVILSNVIIPKIPVIYSTLLIFIGQIVTGIIVDYIFGNPISKGKFIGCTFIILGLVYNSNIDRKALKVNYPKDLI